MRMAGRGPDLRVAEEVAVDQRAHRRRVADRGDAAGFLLAARRALQCFASPLTGRKPEAVTLCDLQDVLPVIEQFARVESLDAHARSAKIRFEK